MSKRSARHDDFVVFHGNIQHLAGVGLRALTKMRLTACTALMARNVLSLWLGRRFSGTDMSS